MRRGDINLAKTADIHNRWYCFKGGGTGKCGVPSYRSAWAEKAGRPRLALLKRPKRKEEPIGSFINNKARKAQCKKLFARATMSNEKL